MAGDPQFGPAPDQDVPATSRAREVRDPVALRHAVDDALAHGRSPGAVYAQLVRPVLAPYATVEGGGPATDTRRALARSIARSAVAQLSARHPARDEGLGRRAVALVPPGPLGELDGRLLADVLEAGGWSVALVALDDDPAVVVTRIVDEQAELAVLPAADAAQVLATQLVCARLRRLPNPPWIVGVAFDTDTEPRGLAADDVVGDVDGLPPLLRRRLSGGGVPWGVRLAREAQGLIVAPVGVLDATSAGRLREIVESRRLLYPRILIDLRELLAADRPGLDALVAWDVELPWDPTVVAVADTRSLAALRAAGLDGRLPIAS